LEVWEKVFLGKAEFMQSTHGMAGCVICHGGDSSLQEKEAAHLGIIADPSDVSCTSCHREIVNVNEDSLHTSVTGMKLSLEKRGGVFGEGSPLDQAFDNHCNSCHTSCGQCHVSRPDESGGGLVSDHKFLAQPSMQYNCTACHGSRVGDEYLGNNEGIPGDLHWNKAGMTCAACHGDELHGSVSPEEDRYTEHEVKCETCHQDVWTATEGNPQHEQHLGDLSCQVCHSITYSNCYDCHVAKDQAGLPYRTSDPTVMEFKIGLNPIRSSSTPYKYVVVRHVPVSENTFSYYGSNLLPDFDALPTWKYATPHNIQLETPQNASCDACHGNDELFLTEDDVRPEEREANKGVILDKAPTP
jgi:thiosulfate/3-mercaptopyruvate sulfurtransferase